MRAIARFAGHIWVFCAVGWTGIGWLSWPYLGEDLQMFLVLAVMGCAALALRYWRWDS